MKHNHRVLPGHMGGKYEPGNVIAVEITTCDTTTANHVMWHYANWLLHGKWEDQIAYKGLAGFYGKEELVDNLMQMGRDKGKLNREAALKAMFEEGTHPFQNSNLIEKMRPVHARCIAEYNRSSEGRLKSRETVTSTNLRRNKCPHCDFVSNPGNLVKHIRQSHKGGVK